MFGSDQMIWPAAIPRAIEAIEAAEFLSQEQKRDIFCHNAARFFRLEPGLCGEQPRRGSVKLSRCSPQITHGVCPSCYASVLRAPLA